MSSGLNEGKQYNEVLALIDLMPSYDYYKIPTKVITLLKKRAIQNYEVKFENIKNSNISRKAYLIYLGLYKKYIANVQENKKIDEILILNDKKKQQKYNDIFKNKKPEESYNKLVAIEEKSILRKILNKIKQVMKI